MKNFRFIITLTLLCFFSKAAIAEKKITGAFGIAFGDVLDESLVIRESAISTRESIYQVKPGKANPSFEIYEVQITKESRKIYSITGTGVFQSKVEAKQQQAELLKLLEDMYGLSEEKDGFHIFSKPEGLILLRVVDRDDGTAKLIIRYQVNSITALEKKEPPSTSFDVISGAFGFKFGEVFDPSTALEKRPVSAGGHIYVVKPPSPNELFSDYFLVITPKTHKIVGIWANRMFKDKNEALGKQAILKSVLEGKYGKASERGSQNDKFVIQQPDESVSVTILENSDKEAFILLKYHSDKLNGLFVQEMQEEAAGKVDKSGF